MTASCAIPRPKQSKAWWDVYHAIVRDIHHGAPGEGFYPSAARSATAALDALGIGKWEMTESASLQETK